MERVGNAIKSIVLLSSLCIIDVHVISRCSSRQCSKCLRNGLAMSRLVKTPASLVVLNARSLISCALRGQNSRNLRASFGVVLKVNLLLR